MMWLRINCVDVPAVILDMETKLNKTLAPVQWQVQCWLSEQWGTLLLLGPVGSQSPSLGCSHSGGGEAPHRAGLSVNLGHLTVTGSEEKDFCLHRGHWNRPCPPASSFRALPEQQQELKQLHWEGKASAELLPSAGCSLGSQGSSASLGFAHWPRTGMCAQSGTGMRHWPRNSNSTTLMIQGFIK